MEESQKGEATGTAAAAQSLAFTVDTHLLRELGALLVGRDSTALVELIKNAYDADATRVVIHGERLTERGLISVDDDGHGMTYGDFVDKFLRIAGRSKEGGARRSPRYGRKYTGAKGIGRLAAHKLGKNLALESVPDLSLMSRSAGDGGFQARIDWEALEKSTKSINDAREVSVSRLARHGGRPGTLLTIHQLHSGWTTRQLNEFLSEVRSTRPDPALYAPIKANVAPHPLMMPAIAIADTSPDDPGFSIELSGEFAGTEAQWPTLLAHVNWIIEIDARSRTQILYRIAPTRLTVNTIPQAAERVFSHERKTPGPRFAARIFVRDGSAARGIGGSARLPDLLARFAKEASGVRLFFEGFRVLPYGNSRNDWLSLDRNYTRREGLQYVDELLPREVRSAADERTYVLPNANYFGGVFLHDEKSGGLQMVVNREGFLPGDALDDLIETVRRGIDLSVRIRASHGAHAREEDAERKRRETSALISSIVSTGQRGEAQEPSVERPRLESLLTAGGEAARSLRTQLGNASAPEVRTQLQVVQAVLDEAIRYNETTLDEQSQLRVLASLGTQVGAFVHEVNGLLAQARTVRDLIDELIDVGAVRPGHVGRLRDVRRAQNELVSALERQAIYLSDSIGAEARRRRVRQKVVDRWATAERLLSAAAGRRAVALLNEIPPEVKTPPMFPAELNVILTNLLSNAIKAAAASPESRDRRVRVRAARSDDSVTIVMENTGVAVDLATADRWFRPFETTTSELDMSLGQGLGLGLTLTRRIIEEYGGEISFVPPSPDMATAVQVRFPNR